MSRKFYMIWINVFFSLSENLEVIRRVTSLLSPSKNMQFCNEQIRTQPLFSPPCASATYGSARMCRRKNCTWWHQAITWNNVDILNNISVTFEFVFWPSAKWWPFCLHHNLLSFTKFFPDLPSLVGVPTSALPSLKNVNWHVISYPDNGLKERWDQVNFPH